MEAHIISNRCVEFNRFKTLQNGQFPTGLGADMGRFSLHHDHAIRLAMPTSLEMAEVSTGGDNMPA